MKILLSGAFIDFYVNKDKFESLKTEKGRFNYAHRELDKILKSLKGRIIEGAEIRDANITSNNYWGQDELCIINDIGSRGDDKPLRQDKITIRVFQIDLVSVVVNESFNPFFNVGNKNFKLSISNYRAV